MPADDDRFERIRRKLDAATMAIFALELEVSSDPNDATRKAVYRARADIRWRVSAHIRAAQLEAERAREPARWECDGCGAHNHERSGPCVGCKLSSPTRREVAP